MAPSGASGPTLAEVSEAELLELILPRLRGGPPVLVGPGDDAAVMRTQGCTVVTTDTMARGRDWRDEWSRPQDVGAKIVAQNVADVAAMGARPTGLVVAVLADPATPVAWMLDFADGLGAAARAADVAVLGGDLSSAPAGTLVVAVTAVGELDDCRPVLRSGANPGDLIAVAGTLGMAAAGWRLLEQGRPQVHPEAVRTQLSPDPPIGQGPLAARAGASAMLDVSDGLLRDGDRIARASGVCLDLDREALAADVRVLRDALGDELAWECVLAGGEEHSLLATFPGPPPAGWRVVGRVVAGTGVRLDGIPQTARGWDHFHA